MEMDTYLNIYDTLNTSRRSHKYPEHGRKLFIGSLDDSATNDSLQAYFKQWGEIVDAVVMKDPITKRSKGFGFITYSQPSMVDRAMSNRPHIINGREVETKRKRIVSRDNICESNISTTVNSIYVYGIKEISENDLHEYFGKFGNIINLKIITDKDSGKRKGFGFIEYDDANSVDKAVLFKNHQIDGERMIVNKAIRRAYNDTSGSPGGHGDRDGAVLNSSLEGNPKNGQCGGHKNKSNGVDGVDEVYGNSGTVRGCSYVGNVGGYGGSTVMYNSNYGGAWQGAPQRWVNNNPSWGNQRGGSWGSLQRPSYNLDPNQSYDPMKACYNSQYSAWCNQIDGGAGGPHQPCYSLDPNQSYGPIKSYYTSNYRAKPNGNPETYYENAGEM